MSAFMILLPSTSIETDVTYGLHFPIWEMMYSITSFGVVMSISTIILMGLPPDMLYCGVG